MSAGRAGGRGRGIRPSRAKPDGYMSGSQVDDQAGDEERGDTARSLLQHFLVRFLDQRQSADAGADDDAKPIAVQLALLEPGVVEGYLRGRQGVMDEGIGLLDF